MKQPLDLFQARIAFIEIPNSRSALADMQAGKRVFGYLTPEASRALRDVLIKLGGPSSDTSIEGELQVFAPPVTGDSVQADTFASMVMPAMIQSMVREVVLQEMARFMPAENETCDRQVFATGEQNIPDEP